MKNPQMTRSPYVNPIDFEQSNMTWHKPKNMSNCVDLKVYRAPEDEFSISCWKAPLKERIKFLFSGIAWLWVFGATHPPVIVSVQDPFAKEK